MVKCVCVCVCVADGRGKRNASETHSLLLFGARIKKTCGDATTMAAPLPDLAVLRDEARAALIDFLDAVSFALCV